MQEKGIESEPTELYTLRLMVMHRGQLIAKLGKRIHAQRETIKNLQEDIQHNAHAVANLKDVIQDLNIKIAVNEL